MAEMRLEKSNPARRGASSGGARRGRSLKHAQSEVFFSGANSENVNEYVFTKTVPARSAVVPRTYAHSFTAALYSRYVYRSLT